MEKLNWFQKIIYLVGCGCCGYWVGYGLGFIIISCIKNW